MGEIFQEFETYLANLEKKHMGNVRNKVLELLLLSLEREQIVSIAYRESVIETRIQSVKTTPEIRRVIQYALAWAWKDEEMHAMYVRGALLKMGRFHLKSRAFLMQGLGAIGGWAAAVRQHARWKDAPFSRLFATATTWGGIVSGKIGKDVRKHLDYASFRNFCLFNVEAEKTAWLCWHRLTALANEVPELPEEFADDFKRIEYDELRHEKLFQLLADAIDENDQVVETESLQTLTEKMAAISPYFLARSYRPIAVSENPLGTGGTVCIAQGKTQQEKTPLFREILNQAGLAEIVNERSSVCQKPPEELNVAIKPTFMLGYHKKDQSPVTDAVLLDALAVYLRELGCRKIRVVEGPNIYDAFYKNRSVQEVAEYFSFSSPHYELIDVSKEQVPHDFLRGLAQSTVSRTWKEADLRVSFGKMRSHPIELALLTVGNIEGLGKRCEEFIFVERQAHRETATMTLLSDFPPHFSILDAYECVPDGLLGVMGCPNPKSVLRFYAGRDALAVDMVAGRHMGIKSFHESSILKAAFHWFGDPNVKINVVGSDEPVKNWKHPYHNEISTFLCFLAFPVYVLGSWRGALFVPEMDTDSFPPLKPVSFWLRSGRRAIQFLLGLRFPAP